MVKQHIIFSGVIGIVLLLFSCASMPGTPGHITESISKFDNSVHLSMEPAWLWNSPIKLGLNKSSSMPDSAIVLIAIVKGANNFGTGKTLHFNVDGTKYHFKSIDQLTDIETSSGFVGSGMYVPPANWSSKRYIVSKQFIYILLNANRVFVRIDLSKKFVEGEFSREAPTTAKPAFDKFMQRVAKM